MLISFSPAITLAAPDFVVNDIALSPSSPSPNSVFSASIKVKNRGETAGNGGKLTIWVNKSATQRCNKKGNKSVTVGTLAAGESKVLTIKKLIMKTTGTKKLRAFVDSSCLTGESNEGNNQKVQIYEVTTTKVAALNDTSITTCSDESVTDLPCPIADYPGQDADHGRDATQNNDTDGHAGFSFTKLDVNGKPLPVSASDWSCVKDNVTGLIWEVKTDDGGLSDKDNTYTWYNPDPKTNGGAVGTQGAEGPGSCTGNISCDTYSFVQKVNAQGLCGYKDWRMPSSGELFGITDLRGVRPTIDVSFFPNTVASYFWSGSPVAGGLDYARDVYFYSGGDHWDERSSAFAVRLVRTGQ
jgi:hypothetical protein